MTGADRPSLLKIENAVRGDSVYRRTIIRADGRAVHLFGYEANMHPVEPQNADEIAKGGELRWHPLRQEWNIYAAHRQNRTFKPVAAENPLAPSLPGAPTTEIPVADFELAVFENKFTSLHAEAPEPTAPAGVNTAPARGCCEVIVYSPEAKGDLYSIGQDRRRLLLAAWINRYQELFDLGCEFVLPFENRGEDVGVTLHHPHGQIYGFDRLPPAQERSVAAFQQGYDLAKDIREFGQAYIIAEAGGMISFCPPYARFPYEVWIAPREARAGPWAFSEEDNEAFAYLIGDVVRRYDAFFRQETPSMFALHAAPRPMQDRYHVTAQFYPLLRAPGRLKYLASVEQHTGAFTVDVMPEVAASALKDM